MVPIAHRHAEYMHGIASVQDADIIGMPPSETRAKRIAIALHIQARLTRLGTLMKER